MNEPSQQVITAVEAAQAATERKSLIATFAERYGIEPNRMMATLKATAFRQRQGEPEISNEQMAALLVVANAHRLNPFTKEIHAFSSRGGIVAVVGVDGWAKLVNEHPAFDGMDFAQDDVSCTCTIHRKDRSHPTTVTEYLAECKRQNSDPWTTHPKRMLRHKAMIQCARLAFSFAGIYDPDEAEGVVAAEAIDVTPREDEEMSGKIGHKRMRKIVEAILEAVQREDGPGLIQLKDELNDEKLQVNSQLRSYERTAIATLESKARAALEDQGDPNYIEPLPAPVVEHLNAWSITAIQAAKDADNLKSIWKSVQGAFKQEGREVPGDVNTIYQDRKTELSKTGFRSK